MRSFIILISGYTNAYVSPSRSRYDAFRFSFAAADHPRELEVQPSGDNNNNSKESKAEDAGVHTPCMLNVLHERTGVLSEHLSDWVKGSALRALKAAEEKEGGDMKEVMTADVPVWFQLSHLRWSGETTAVEDVLKTKMESGHLLIPYGRDDCQTLILEGNGRISPLAAIVDARAAVEERKGKERLMRETRVKQEFKMAIQGTGGCFFVAERREDGVVRPNKMNSIPCCVSIGNSTKCRNCGV